MDEEGVEAEVTERAAEAIEDVGQCEAAVDRCTTPVANDDRWRQQYVVKTSREGVDGTDLFVSDHHMPTARPLLISATMQYSVTTVQLSSSQLPQLCPYERWIGDSDSVVCAGAPHLTTGRIHNEPETHDGRGSREQTSEEVNAIHVML